ncbi:MAG: molybdopterin cofactor-binding domain-containing protein [Chloroflexota bacterium]
MFKTITLHVNGKTVSFTGNPETPLLYVLRNHLELVGTKFGCGLEQCNACKVLIDGADVPSCQIPVQQVAGLEITTIEGLGSAEQLHPLQEAFVEEQAIQCGYCASGMIMAAQGLLNRVRYPSDDAIREALDGNICRCGVHERIRRAIKMRIGQPHWEPVYEVVEPPALEGPSAHIPKDNLQLNPDLDSWIRFNADETVTIFTGKVEIGQGIKTAVSQIAADELDVALERIRVQTADTALSPNEGLTAGSMSVEMSGRSLRQAAATARHLLLQMAFEELETDQIDALDIVDGTIRDTTTGRQTTFWALMAQRGAVFGQAVRSDLAPKRPPEHQLVGQPLKRDDLIPKVTGQACYVHDLTLPDMVHGRVVRPPGYGARLVSVDETAVLQMSGILAVVRDGSFLGVVAEREEEAIWAQETLRETAVWDNQTKFIKPDDLQAHLQANATESNLVVNGTAVSNPIPPRQPATMPAKTITATYTKPYHMHGSLAPSAAVAQWQPATEQLTIWSHTQGPHMLRGAIAEALGMSEKQVRVVHAEGSGCYGHNGADDAAFDAALLARAFPERPISLKWMREDEHLWEPYGPAMMVQLAATLDDAGNVNTWEQDIWSYSHLSRPRPTGDGTSSLLATRHLRQPQPPAPARNLLGRHFGGYRNADPLYHFAQRHIVSHFVPDSPLRSSAVRSLGAYANIFAIESFMDELAEMAGMDPVAFRLQHLSDERAKAVIQAAADKAGWTPRTKPNKSGKGRGIAFAQYKNIQCYTAIVVELTVNQQSGEIQLDRAVIAADAGQIVNPDGLSNQLEGGFVQAASWTLMEAVEFDESRILSQDWDSYPILRFAGVPKIETVLLNRPSLPSLGTGEASQNPTPAAIANAIYDAIGVRPRDLPFTPDKIQLEG